MSPSEESDIQWLLDRGLATRDQIDEARAICEKMDSMGLRARSVPEVLLEKGYIENEDIETLRREDHSVHGREQIAGYKLLELLGRGPKGAVYKAHQISLDREVAMKVLDETLGADEEYAERFMREARAVARLSHTNLISGIDVGEDDGVRYLVMEFADGVTVSHLLRRGGAMDEERALVIAQQIARALDYAHKNGVVHRDVKPDDIIITRDGVAKLCDLGVARLEGAADTGGLEPTGSPDYLSPEQARGHTEVGAAADVYGLGGTLFHMVTGRVPFKAATREAVLAKHLTEPAPSPRALVADLSSATETIVMRCLAKNPTDRYERASELVDALEGAIRTLQAARGAAPGVAPGPAPAKAPPPPPSPGLPTPPTGKGKPPKGAVPMTRRQRRRRH